MGSKITWPSYTWKSLQYTLDYNTVHLCQEHLMQEVRGRDLFRWYCWWKKFCTTWEVWTPVNNGIFTISSADPRIFSIHSIVWEKKYSTNCHVWTSHISSYSWTYWGEPGMSPTQSKISGGAWVSDVFSCSWWETNIVFVKVTEGQRKRIYLNRTKTRQAS